MVYHLVDSTALYASSQPVAAAIDTLVAGLSNDVSKSTRVYTALLTYAGLGGLIGKGRDLSRKFFGITQETTESIQQLHDSLYMAAINFPLTVGLYLAAGETNHKKILIGAIGNTSRVAILGPFFGYSMDVYRDLTGLETCKRQTYPRFIRKLKPRAKRFLAVGLMALSIGLISLVYQFNQDSHYTLKK